MGLGLGLGFGFGVRVRARVRVRVRVRVGARVEAATPTSRACLSSAVMTGAIRAPYFSATMRRLSGSASLVLAATRAASSRSTRRREPTSAWG